VGQLVLWEHPLLTWKSSEDWNKVNNTHICGPQRTTPAKKSRRVLTCTRMAFTEGRALMANRSEPKPGIQASHEGSTQGISHPVTNNSKHMEINDVIEGGGGGDGKRG